MSDIDEIIKGYIQEYMSEMFYLEGKNKDYYFGISKLNDELTVFYNDIGDSTENLVKSIINAINGGLDKFAREYGLGTAGGYTKDLSISALNIPAYIVGKYLMKDGKKYTFQINFMKTDVLEDAIKNNPERWAQYERIKNNDC